MLENKADPRELDRHAREEALRAAVLALAPRGGQAHAAAVAEMGARELAAVIKKLSGNRVRSVHYFRLGDLVSYVLEDGSKGRFSPADVR